MRNDSTLRLGPPHRSPTDGWLGTPELPAYRAGNVIARLDDLPGVDHDHLYFDLLLLDPAGQLQDNLSGPCGALERHESPEARSRFVRVVAELVRHAPSDDRGLTAAVPALTLVRERGVQTDRLVLAAQLLDDACEERAVIASLSHLLALSLGVDEATRTMADVVAKLGPDAAPINAAGLEAQVAHVVQTVGKLRARRYLRETIPFEMVASAEMLGV